MKRTVVLFSLGVLSLAGVAGVAFAEPVTYTLDPSHTYPSFEADHMGVSLWRGKFNKTTGTVVLDKAAGTGTVDLAVEVDSVDFGHDLMNTKARGPEIFDSAKFPLATYKGRLEGFTNGTPTRVAGELTLHGVTRPVVLTLNAFKCIAHPMFKRELCGADAQTTLQRDEFGIDAGKFYGFRMDVLLRIQVEAVETER